MENNFTHYKKYSLAHITQFFVLTFVITWSMFYLATRVVPAEYETLFIILGAFGPLTAAMIVIRFSQGPGELRNWLKQNFRFRIPILLYLAGAFFIPITIGVLQFGLYVLFGGEPDFSQAEPWYLYLLYLIPTALLTGGNEEPGWRGFALPTLLARFHPLIATVILGFLHGAWHLPLMSHYDTTFGWYLFNILPLTFVLNWFYIKWPQSIFPVMLFHSGTNVISNFIPTPMDVLGGLGTWIFMRGVVYWIMTLVILITTRGGLGYESHESA
jgi:membrane protease YdiL (CAAX protease family)